MLVEKGKAHCRLSRVRDLVAAGRIRVTASALAGAASLGMDFEDVVAVVSALRAVDFYKSMTTNADHRVWQDVYRPKTPFGAVYVKLIVIDDVLIVSFKEL